MDNFIKEIIINFSRNHYLNEMCDEREVLSDKDSLAYKIIYNI